MNKLLKGAIAGAAGVALLLGGAGTFALWNDTASVNAGKISSGTLTMDAAAAGAWTDISADRPADTTAINPETYMIVPGDTFQLVQEVVVNATGDNLKAILTIDENSILAGLPSGSAALKDALKFTLDADGNGVAPTATANEFIITPPASATTVTLTLTVELPLTTMDKVAQDGRVNLSNLRFTLKQTRS